jgi:transposase
MVKYVHTLRERHNSVGWRNRTLSALRTFFETCAHRLHLPDLTKEQLIFDEDFLNAPYSLSREVPEEVLEQVRTHLDALPTTVLRMVTILLEVGLRVNELCSLPLDCLICDDRHEWYLRFYQRKTHQEQVIPLVDTQVVGAIQAQQQEIREQWLIPAFGEALEIFEKPAILVEAHPDVDVVSRDRGGTCLDGVTQGAPLATQIGDRWHLMKILGEAVEAFLIRTRTRIADKLSQQEVSMSVSPPPAPPRPLTHREELAEIGLKERQDICQQAKDLHAKGWSIHAIARHLDRERTTIRKDLKVEGLWQRPPRTPGKSLLDPYRETILALWQQGCRNGQHILRTIRTQGYEGSDTLLRAYVTGLRKQLPVKAPSSSQTPSSIQTLPKTPREIRWLLTRHREDLTAEEQADLDCLLDASEEVRTIRRLPHKFLNMVRQRKHEQLRPWMEAAMKSGIAELKSFVAGIERDFDAVKAALRLPWSQGITEGKVNKLKTIKRVMYGKAGFALLRQRLLHDA